jgi:hypothetical protein
MLFDWSGAGQVPGVQATEQCQLATGVTVAVMPSGSMCPPSFTP